MAVHFLALLFTASALASPVPEISSRQTCQVQSCTIAALSGSSGQPYDPSTPPTGGTDAGDCCIISYNPSVAPVLYQENPNLQSECAANATQRSAEKAAALSHSRQASGCLPYTLIYAAGTFETPPLGGTVGPALAQGLNSTDPGLWNIQGVYYNTTIDGDDCLGLPGGAQGTQLLDLIADVCPDTKIIVSGYSQGAMVSHNAVANSANAHRVNAVVVFGDPFDGAPIKGYSGPIRTYCATGDDVCDGEFEISAAHLSYVGANTTDAVAYMSNLVKS